MTKAEKDRAYQARMAMIVEAVKADGYTQEEIARLQREAWEDSYGDQD